MPAFCNCVYQIYLRVQVQPWKLHLHRCAEVPVMSGKPSVCMLLDLIYMICNVDCLEMQLLRFDGD